MNGNEARVNGCVGGLSSCMHPLFVNAMPVGVWKVWRFLHVSTRYLYLFFSFDLVDDTAVLIFYGYSCRIQFCFGKRQERFVLGHFHVIKAIFLPALGELFSKLLLSV